MKTIHAPPGMTGLAVEPWARGEIYAVAARWSNAKCGVLAYGPDGWHETGRQVADFRHRMELALWHEIRQAIYPRCESDDDEIDSILSEAEYLIQAKG